LREEASTIDERLHPGGLEPAGNLVGIEPYPMSPSEVRDAPLRDETADMTIGDAEMIGETGDVEQMR
jgi:hypothetical protein